MRVLRTDVYVGGRRWRAGSAPPPEVAERIPNEQAWVDDGAGDAPPPPPAPPPTPEPAPVPEPEIVQPVPEQPNAGPGDDTVIGEVVVDPTPLLPPGGTEATNNTGEAETVVPAQPGDVGVEQQLRPPPRSGRGSGLTEWLAFADAAGVDVPDDAERAEIIAACEAAGVLDA